MVRDWLLCGMCCHHVTVCVSVCVSMCLSVSGQYYVEMAKLMMTQTAPHDSPMTEFMTPNAGEVG